MLSQSTNVRDVSPTVVFQLAGSPVPPFVFVFFLLPLCFVFSSPFLFEGFPLKPFKSQATSRMDFSQLHCGPGVTSQEQHKEDRWSFFRCQAGGAESQEGRCFSTWGGGGDIWSMLAWWLNPKDLPPQPQSKRLWVMSFWFPPEGCYST